MALGWLLIMFISPVISQGNFLGNVCMYLYMYGMYAFSNINHYTCTLQKQIGCFNHRVVTLVASWRDSGYERFTVIGRLIALCNPRGSQPSSFYNHSTPTTLVREPPARIKDMKVSYCNFKSHSVVETTNLFLQCDTL